MGLVVKIDEHIRGINIEGSGGNEKIFQYADDTTIIVKDIESVKKVMEIVQMFCGGSEGKINEKKTVYMRFGGVIGLTDSFNFKETKEIKILGVLMGKDEKNVKEIMWEEIAGGIERRLNIWKLRTLSLKGKVLILNGLMVSKLWYVLYVTAMPM